MPNPQINDCKYKKKHAKSVPKNRGPHQIAYNQPFNNGNKATAYVITKYYLRKNGYALALKTKEEEKILFTLLDNITIKFEGVDIVSDAETYLDNKVIPKF